MKYPSTSTFKLEDSFVLVCVYKENDTATSVTGVTIRSQLRYSLGEKVCDLVATPNTNQAINPGVFSLASAGKYGRFFLDLTDGGN